MRGLLVVNKFLNTDKFSDIYSRLSSAFGAQNAELSLCTNADFLSDAGSPLVFSEKPDFILFWDKDVLLARRFEGAGIPVFNSSKSIEICDNKAKMHLALQGLPMPETYISPMTFPNIGFSDLSFLNEIERKLSYPIIIKEAFGSFGAQVYMANDRTALFEVTKAHETVPLIFQKPVAESLGRDIRINTVGGRAVAAMMRKSGGDFRSNITLGGETVPYTPTDAEISLAEEASRRLGLDFAGVDILFGASGPVLCEVNSNSHFKSTFDCTGIDLSSLIAEHIIGKCR